MQILLIAPFLMIGKGHRLILMKKVSLLLFITLKTKNLGN